MTSRPEHPAPAVVECVAESGRSAVLVALDAAGAASYREIPVSPVPAYQRGVLAVVALLVAFAAVALRPVSAGWPWWQLAVLDLVVTATSALLTTRIAGYILARVTESIVVDTARAIFTPATTNPAAEKE